MYCIACFTLKTFPMNDMQSRLSSLSAELLTCCHIPRAVGSYSQFCLAYDADSLHYEQECPK